MHKYNREEAQQIANEIKKYQGEDTQKIIKKGLAKRAKVLDQNPNHYLSYGPYWWIIKKLFAAYLPGKKWYQTGVYNAVDVVKYGFDDDFLNYAAAVYYSSHCDLYNPSFHVLSPGDGFDDIRYSIYDEDAPAL